jgi:hypothetical protein
MPDLKWGFMIKPFKMVLFPTLGLPMSKMFTSSGEVEAIAKNYVRLQDTTGLA